MIDCDVCGERIQEGSIYVIPDERTVCMECNFDWLLACLRIVQGRPELWDQVDHEFNRLVEGRE